MKPIEVSQQTKTYLTFGLISFIIIILGNYYLWWFKYFLITIIFIIITIGIFWLYNNYLKIPKVKTNGNL